VKLYRFSKHTLTYAELPWARTKLFVSGLAFGVVLLLGVLEVNGRYGDTLGLGYTRTNLLIQENAILRGQIASINDRIGVLQDNLVKLNDRGNHMRLLMDISRIPEDVRQAGTGGASMDVDFNTSLDVSKELNTLRTTMTVAEKELQLQFSSYREIAEKYSENKTRFAALPAIRPMNGYYSRKGPRVRLHPILNIYRRHEGIDIAADVGTPIYAPADGVVEFVGRSSGYGNTVEINHGFSYRTLYGHLSKALVQEGQRVKRGQLIARCGSTGLSSGPHLHYEVRKNGVPQNPLEYFFDDVDYVAEAGASLPDEAMESLYIKD